MQTVLSTEALGVRDGDGDALRTVERTESPSHAILQNVAMGTILYRPGDERCVYRVERGAMCHYMRWTDGHHDVIEFAFPGDIIGLGHLNTHVSTAQAMVETVVSLVPEAELALEHDQRMSSLLADAGEREFDYLRDKAMNSAKRGPVQRLAYYLIAVSSMNAFEGREPAIISEEISSGFVADRLQMNIDVLAKALLHLKQEGLIAATGDGLRIVNADALERFAEAA